MATKRKTPRSTAQAREVAPEAVAVKPAKEVLAPSFNEVTDRQEIDGTHWVVINGVMRDLNKLVASGKEVVVVLPKKTSPPESEVTDLVNALAAFLDDARTQKAVVFVGCCNP
jgi:hypothetical protein